MAEGVTEDVLPIETLGDEEAPGDAAVPDAPEMDEQLVVRPKRREQPKGSGAAEQRPETGREELQEPGLTGARSQAPPYAGSQFLGWRERQWVEEEEGEWSYSTSPGTSTMIFLQE